MKYREHTFLTLQQQVTGLILKWHIEQTVFALHPKFAYVESEQSNTKWSVYKLWYTLMLFKE